MAATTSVFIFLFISTSVFVSAGKVNLQNEIDELRQRMEDVLAGVVDIVSVLSEAVNNTADRDNKDTYIDKENQTSTHVDNYGVNTDKPNELETAKRTMLLLDSFEAKLKFVEKGLKDEKKAVRNLFKEILNVTEKNTDKILGSVLAFDKNLESITERIETISEDENERYNRTQLEIDRVAKELYKNGEEIHKLRNEDSVIKQIIKDSNNVLTTELFNFITHEPSKWSWYGGSLYRVFDDEVDWDAAMRKCKTYGGYLSEIDSTSEYNFVSTLPLPHHTYWIGGTDVRTEGTWYWKHSGKSIQYTYWRDGEPNNARNGEHCMVMYSTNKKWNDLPCHRTCRFICEITL